MSDTATITAIATATGRGGVGIIRVSGQLAPVIAQAMLGFMPEARKAHFADFLDADGLPIDQGIGLYFPGPNSFTGEDVFELQGHGGPIVLDMLLQRVVSQGARLARPGEFSERAFLNDKMDLAQAEAVADLIDAVSEQAAKSALRSMQGAFSHAVNSLVDALIHLRIYVEAAIDFPEEEIDFLADGKVAHDLANIRQHLTEVMIEANRGSLMRDGMKVVIAGRPNAGKSSLLNALAGKDSAIVTHIPGTTRDVLREHIHIDGMPLHIIDTAGLRDTDDEVEQIGIERAWTEIRDADVVLLMVDSTDNPPQKAADIWPEFVAQLPANERITIVRNKCDLSDEPASIATYAGQTTVALSAKQALGIDLLRDHLKQIMGYESQTEGGFIARRRHLDALQRADESLANGDAQLRGYGAGELLAEDLRAAQNALSEITRAFTSDDLLGRIFSSFCINK